MGRALLIGKDGPVSSALHASGALRGHEIHHCSGDVEAVHLVRARAFDVVVTDTETSISEDLALAQELSDGAGFDSERVIEVTAARTARAIVYHFRNPGTGFDRGSLTRAAGSPDPDEVVASALRRAELGLRPGGFGMLIARQVADELVYNERGNEAILVKHLD